MNWAVMIFVSTALINFGLAIPMKSMRGERNVPPVTAPAEISLPTSDTPVSAPPIFAQVDADKNHSISFNEFSKVMSARDPELVREMFELFDTDVDQQLNEEEYGRFIRDMNSYLSQTTDDVFKRFEAMDTNEDQFVDLEEFKVWVEQNGGQTDIYEKLFKLSDSNNDDKINFSEFVSEL